MWEIIRGAGTVDSEGERFDPGVVGEIFWGSGTVTLGWKSHENIFWISNPHVTPETMANDRWGPKGTAAEGMVGKGEMAEVQKRRSICACARSDTGVKPWENIFSMRSKVFWDGSGRIPHKGKWGYF